MLQKAQFDREIQNFVSALLTFDLPILQNYGNWKTFDQLGNINFHLANYYNYRVVRIIVKAVRKDKKYKNKYGIVMFTQLKSEG